MIKYIQLLIISALVSVFSSSALAAGIDVYITYMGKDKTIKQSIQNALPADLTVKYYNASALAMADYSGKQKAVAKLSKAKLVVVIKAQTMDILGSPTFAKHVVVESADASELAKITASL